MATPDELRSATAEGRAVFRAAIEAAAANWERRPPPSGSEEAWSALQAAEHTIQAEIWFASEVCKACGNPGLDPIEPSYASTAEAAQAFGEVSAKCDGRLKYVTEKDLAMPSGELGTVEEVMRYNAQHLREHAAQMRTAAGA